MHPKLPHGLAACDVFQYCKVRSHLVGFVSITKETNMQDMKFSDTTEIQLTMLTETELSVRWKLSVRTLQFWRYKKTGPKYIKLHGSAVRYPINEIKAYELQAGLA